MSESQDCSTSNEPAVEDAANELAYYRLASESAMHMLATVTGTPVEALWATFNQAIRLATLTRDDVVLVNG